MKFHEAILNDFQVKEQTQFCDNVPREIIQKVLIQELWFLCSEGNLMLIVIHMMLYDDILNSFQVTE